MKRCQVCGFETQDSDHLTCPACGEASWLPLKAPAPAPVAPDTKPTVPPSKKDKS